MTDELIDILSEDYQIIDTCMKSEAHKKGLLHASVHVWLYTPEKKVLIQKRSLDKVAFPGLWDVSVAGHIGTGESSLTTAIRETNEEIGLKLNKNELFEIGTFLEYKKFNDNFIDNELHYIFIAELKSLITDLKIQKEEVEEIQLIPLEKLKKELFENSNEYDFCNHPKEYYQLVIKYLELRLDI